MGFDGNPTDCPFQLYKNLKYTGITLQTETHMKAAIELLKVTLGHT